jgi:hypothetical protein
MKDEEAAVPGGGVLRWLRLDGVGMGILSIAVPAVLALAADPIAALVDTAFVGHLGNKIFHSGCPCILDYDIKADWCLSNLNNNIHNQIVLHQYYNGSILSL